MPPKSLPPARTTRATARKSILPKVLSRCTSGSSQGSSGPAPPPATSVATARPASELNLKDDGLLLTSPDSNPKVENSLPYREASLLANSSPEPQDKTKKKVVARPGKKIREGDQVPELPVTNLGSAGPETGGVGAELDGKPGTMVVADAGLEAVKGKGGNEALPEVDKAAVGACGSAKVGEGRTRKVVKKTVRIVKKIVKRRVPKRTITGNEGTKGVMNALDSSEAEKLPSAATLAKVDFDGTVVNASSNGSTDDGEMETVANVDLFEDRDEVLEPAVSKLNSVENIGTEVKSKINCTGVLKIQNENLEELQGHAEEVSKINPSVSVKTEEQNKINCTALEIENENLRAIQGHAEEITEIRSSVPIETEETSETNCTDALEIENEKLRVEGENVEADENEGKESIMVEDQLKNGKLGIVEMKTGDSVEDLIGLSNQEGRTDGEEKNDVVNGAPLLSGEMEAMERRKRRKTEIFVGGLDKDAKEEDIRKLFEQVGEVKRLRLVKNSDSGRNKGFAFLQFALAADAKKALEKFSTVEICGKQCGVRPVEGNDTIYLGHINKKWKSEDVVQHLKAVKIQNIDNVIVMANPTNFEQNRGFAFVEFQTCKDAQIAFNKLQKCDLFVKQMKIKVAWAQPLDEPDEEEMLKVKSVYVEYIPSSWDEAKARNFFKRFGEIESISLAKNLPLSRRKDIAFVNYSTRQAALACIEAFAHEKVDDAGSEVKVKVSLAKPFKKMKQAKQVLGTSGKEQVKEKRITSNVMTFHEPLRIEKHISNNLASIRVDRAASTTDELLQILRQQAHVRQLQPASFDPNHHYASAGSKRPFSALGNHANFPEPRGVPHPYPETSHLYGSASAFSSRVDAVSLPSSQRQHMGYTLEPPHGFENDPYFKTRERAAHFGHGSGMYRRY